ncbi:hypothetical protein [Zooshikella sp. RANM57]|uniref:hypothetical protein n=1 Tax=Zooshikella sp. RANM57 TaxID=3425863 RepID=UPI003D6FA400
MTTVEWMIIFCGISASFATILYLVIPWKVLRLSFVKGNDRKLGLIWREKVKIIDYQLSPTPNPIRTKELNTYILSSLFFLSGFLVYIYTTHTYFPFNIITNELFHAFVLTLFFCVLTYFLWHIQDTLIKSSTTFKLWIINLSAKFIMRKHYKGKHIPLSSHNFCK